MFPVRRLFCIGRNYAAHAHEMGKDPTRDPPFFFTKWAEAVVPTGSTIVYPPETADYHHEGELVVAIGGEGFRLSGEHASSVIFGYACGLDMTRRDLQNIAKKNAWPWDVAKNVPQSAPLGPITKAAAAGDIGKAKIELTVNGAVRQRGVIADMIWSIPELVAEVSKFYRLMPGDLIFTGTPSGVAAVSPGDVLHVAIDGLASLDVTIGQSWV